MDENERVKSMKRFLAVQCDERDVDCRSSVND